MFSTSGLKFEGRRLRGGSAGGEASVVRRELLCVRGESIPSQPGSEVCRYHLGHCRGAARCS